MKGLDIWACLIAAPGCWSTRLMKRCADRLSAQGKVANVAAGPPAMQMQEFFCSFDSPILGAVYADALKYLESEGPFVRRASALPTSWLGRLRLESIS